MPPTDATTEPVALPEPDDALSVLLAERAITRVIMSYSRAVDRYDFERLRECYWPDGTDDHGSFVGSRDDFVDFVRASLVRFERTSHFLGNVLVDVDPGGDRARAETYAVAYHRFTDEQGRPTDMTAGLRYVDRFEKRGSQWRIAHRVCAYDWRRTDLVVGRSGFADSYVVGVRSASDAVFTIMGSPTGTEPTYS